MATLPAMQLPMRARPQEALVELLKSLPPDVREAFRRVTEQGARVLDVERVSVWLYDEPRSAIVCEDLFLRSRGKHEHGVRLAAADFPRYFSALEENRTVAARDACADPRTSEFAVGYLDVNGITSMLDAPIRSERSVVGVVCCEHVGPRREWTLVEEDFAGSLADAVALVIERTARLRGEQRCLLLEKRFRALFDANVAASYIAARDGTIIDCNAAFVRLASLSGPNDAVGRAVSEFFMDGERTLFRRTSGEVLSVSHAACALIGEDGAEIGTLMQAAG